MRILVADDYSDTREVMKLLLEGRGHEVIEAADGEEAVQRARQEHPDLVLMDLNMPRLDGFGAAERLRADESTASLPIIALSAHVIDETWQAKALRSGCDACFAKPLDFESIDQLLATADTRASQQKRMRT